MEDTTIKLFTDHGVKPTANRLVVAKTLAASLFPMSLVELESKIQTIDRSNIFRALTLFKEHHLVHAIEDGSGGVRYEICRSHSHDVDEDEHAHFHCELCGKTYCLDYSPVPPIALPEGFAALSVNYLVKGICSECRSKSSNP